MEALTLLSRIKLASFLKYWARVSGAKADHAGNADFAAATALSVSCSEASWTA
jgi:hypothetical protein